MAFVNDPFGSTPDPHFLYTQGKHAEVLAQLRRGFANNARLQTLITPVGLGKTTILFSFKEFVDPLARSVFICNTLLNSGDLLTAIITKLAPTNPDPLRFPTSATLDRILRTLHGAGGRLVIILDEAQDLDSSAIGELGALLQRAPTSVNFVLAGQPELQEKLRHPAMAAWRSVRPLTLTPFDPPDVVRYVQHQLLVAGHKNPGHLHPRCSRPYSELSAGVPRVINQHCSDALMKAFTLGKTVLDCELLDNPIDYTELARSLDNVINMDSFLPTPAPSTPAQVQAPAPPAHAPAPAAALPESAPHDAHMLSPRDSFVVAEHVQLSGPELPGELLSGLRELENSAFAYMSSKEFSRKLEASIPTLESQGIHAELRPIRTVPA